MVIIEKVKYTHETSSRRKTAASPRDPKKSPRSPNENGEGSRLPTAIEQLQIFSELCPHLWALLLPTLSAAFKPALAIFVRTVSKLRFSLSDNARRVLLPPRKCSIATGTAPNAALVPIDFTRLPISDPRPLGIMPARLSMSARARCLLSLDR